MNTFMKKINFKNFFALPYDAKVKKVYFVYAGIFAFFGVLVLIFSLFLMINLAINHEYFWGSNITRINLFLTPIFNIILIFTAWILLLLAPKRVHHSPKQSSIMFYFSFWFLITAVMLNGVLQLTYVQNYYNSGFYHWLNTIFMRIVIILSVFVLFAIQVFFWIMRRKFAFMPNDYEIYGDRIVAKQEKKAAKLQLKQQKAKKE